MACESCRTQARGFLRTALRVRAPGPVAAATRTSVYPAARNLIHQLSSPVQHQAPSNVRQFSSSKSRAMLGSSIRDTYRVVGVSEKLFKVCSKPGDYRITEEERKKDQVQKMEDGEEVGNSVNPDNVWHSTFGLPPTFSTWSHVTMLHLYLLNARLRCFEREEYRSWQQQMIDHFFFECEKKMHVDHHITSSALRQRYLKDIFVQWRGLLLAYDEGLIKGDAVLASAVWRNLFKGSPDVDPRSLVAVVGWMRASLAALEGTSDATLPTRAQEILEKPVDVFWTRLEEPFKKYGTSETSNEAQAAAKVAAESKA